MIVIASVSFAVCAALVALALAATKWLVAAGALFAAAGIGFFSWRRYRGEDGPGFWPMFAVSIFTSAIMLSVC